MKQTSATDTHADSDYLLFGRDDCHLCDLAEQVLLQSATPLPYRKVNIDDDLVLLRKYGTSIPVLRAESAAAELHWPFTAKSLQHWLQSLTVTLRALTVLLAFAVCSAAVAADLPIAMSNNAVAALEHEQGTDYYSFLGLTSAKTWRDVSARAWWLPAAAGQWRELPVVPGPGRLAAVAASTAGSVWLFGGYTVAEDGAEESVPLVLKVNARADPVYQSVASMPVPVDDAVALAYQDRYIYLISGWHDLGNVNLVQVYDTQTDRWQQATPYPGNPVFGHAGGMVDEKMLVCGGVKLEYPATGERRFGVSEQCWLGKVHADDQRRIDWHQTAPMPGPARYRAAAVGDSKGTRIIFAAGSDRAYNYNGIGYDGEPAAALASVVSYDLRTGQWHCHQALTTASMDHRGLLLASEFAELIRIGGMDDQQQVSADWRQQQLPAPQACER